ncbi:MAG: response regulator [Cyanobacteria bacterium P01_E01_bin.45]
MIPVSYLSLSSCLRSYASARVTGSLSVLDRDTGDRWVLKFLLGRLVGDEAGVHPMRRWSRQLMAARLTDDTLVQAGATDRARAYVAVDSALRDCTIDRATGLSILQGSAIEVLFDLLWREMQQSEDGDRLQFISQEEDPAEFGHLPLITLPTMPLLQRSQHQLNTWISAGFSKCSPHKVPVVRDSEQLRKRSSPKVYERLQMLLDGDSSFRDLAVRLNKDMAKIGQTLLPFLKAGLVDIIDRPDRLVSFAPRQQTPTVPAAAHPSLTSTHKETIAYVEDSSLDLKAMEFIVNRLGHDFHGISSSFVALPTLLELQPSVIFLDLVMPIANGYELCAQLRRVTAFKHTPIVIVTSSDGVVDRVRSKLVGATGFISKPFAVEDIAKALERYLPKTTEDGPEPNMRVAPSY